MAGEAAAVSDERAAQDRLRSGSRATVRPIRASLRRYESSLDKNHEAILSLRSNATTAAAWMDWYLDNEYLVRRVLAMLGRSLSAEFASRLPVLVAGADSGSARASVIARQGLARTEHLFDLNATEALVLERLETAALSTAELWALPLLLRFESLRAIFESVEQLLAASAASTAATDQDNGQAAALQAALVANGVRSLHRLEKTDWRGFFERTSAVERTLVGDPGRVYPAMDFETRDAYRSAVEKLSRLVGCDEVTVARAAIELARRDPTGQPLTGHVGHYLVGDGRSQLTESLAFRPPLHLRLRDRLRPHRQALFLGLLAITSLLFVFIPVLYALDRGSFLWAGMTAVLVSVPAMIIASTLLHWGITLALSPRVLPRLDFSRGIPREHRAVICICALVNSTADATRLLEQVERHHLASTDASLRFGLVTGLFDAATATTDRDAPILDALREGTDRLNQRYGEGGDSPFFWLHRQRLLNERDGVWMEWERKRGKLRELNRFILRGDRGTFSDEAGSVSDLRGVPYVLTLDSDTVLPVDAARRLIGTIAHPLNRPVVDAGTGTVTSGYSILQPRVEIDPVTATRNLFTRAFSGDRGLDVYTLAVSDAYQDLFGEGIYTGKGLYHVNAFEASLHDAVPEAAVLSHDLFEGIHGRTALVSDVVVYEDYPVDYLAYLRRLHRWVRGDWQLLPWLGRWVPTASGSRRRNRLEALDRWQIFHNLLRSLLAPVLVVLLLCGWFLLPGSPLHWTILALLTLLVPSLAGAVGLVRSTLRRRRASQLLFGLGGDLRRWLLAVALLPHEALTVADAVCRSLYRTHVSGRHLLEWTPAATDAAVGNRFSAGGLWRAMGLVSGLTLVVGLALVAWRPEALWGATPVLLLWLAAPAIVVALRREPASPRERIRAEDRTHLRRVARRTWLFFERFVGPEDHWLPPDHFQEDPRGVVAHRTSPTNIGLLLLSNAAAYDLGYIDAEECLVRCRNTLRTIESMTRFRGHLLNWYDTHSLTPLPPAYVSTVDSGNLLGCLLTVKSTAAEIRAVAAWRQELFEGLLDATGVMEDSVARSASAGSLEALGGELQALRNRVLETRRWPALWPALVDELTETIRSRIDPRVEAVLHEPGGLPPETLTDLRVWLERSHHHMLRIRECRDRFMAWWPLLAAMPANLTAEDAPAEVRDAVARLRASLEGAPSCIELEGLPSRIAPEADALRAALVAAPEPACGEAEAWLDDLEAAVMRTSTAASGILAIAGEVESSCERLFAETDMRFLYDGVRHLFRIGYDVDRGRMDDNAYDLLASESRLASFLAIAKGDVPARHWAHLGRPLTRDGPDVMLLSWSGTMFEYLMPGLLMPEPQAGLLARSAEGSIASQIRFAASRGIPWGISESGYYLFDPARNYAYRAFGAPSLALQAARGVEDLVVSPYSTFLALPWRPHAATDNLRYLETFGMLGRYGYFEALDFTPRRLDVGQSHALVRSYMAHHHGMSLVSVANALTTQNAITRFSAEPRYGACKLLLQERMPPDPELEYPASPSATPRQVALDTVPALDPWNVPVDTPTPRVHLLSNGRYGVLATNGGGGGSFWNNIALTRWSADSTSDDRGCWVYLEDVDAGDTWSIARQPSSIREGDEQVRFHAHAVEYLRHSRGLVQTLEVTVCPRDDVELRRITLTNHGEQVRRLVLTTYAELVLGDAAADRQHPRFSGLFVQCSYDAEQSLLLFERRSREGSADAGPLLGEFLVGVRGVIKPDGVETDRGAFLERDGSLAKPPKAGHDQGIGAAVGSGLDPIASLRKTLTLEPGATVRLALVRIVAPTREALMQTRQRFAYWANVQYAFDEARTRIARDLHGGGIGPGVLHDLVRLTSALLCPHPDLRAPTAILARNQLGQAGLWGMGISGDHPVVLLKVPQSAGMDVVNLLLKAHEFWRKRNLPIDVVFLATGDDGYSGNTRDALHRAISLRHAEAWIGRRGGLFVLTSASQGEADVVLLHAAASLVLDGGITHPLAALDRLNNADIPLPLLPARPGTDFPPTVDVAPSLPADLKFWNGLGGFTSDGREYVMLIEGVNRPPAAWINVIANPQFGCTVSESGGGYTWWLNSGENRLTPWRNDPVLDMPGECIYLRDEETGDLWCPTPAPMYESGAYLARHGAGYSRFEHCRLGVDSELSLFVDIDQPVKVARLRVSNRSERARRLTVTFYAEWVLGTRRETGAGYLIPAWNAEHRALLVRNPYGAQCPGQTVFLATTQEVHGYTADRSEFLGRDGGLHAPAGLARVGLSGRVDAGRDTCAALQVHVDLPVGGTEEVVFLLGAGANEEAALTLIRGCRDTGAIQRMRDAVDTHWRQRLGTVTLESPDAATDILFNGWLLYQTLASRLHGRTGLYQSSGAFGFRDQLQDTTALLAAAPSLCRAQIVAAAARQFPEGDVLHWWHPPAARGVRTRISDDLLWLPWVVCEYIAATDEVDVLDESITWLSGDPLGAEEGDRYSEYAQSGESASLYEHCLRAIRRVDHAGAHGLPLMGGGDWNDGFNRVGDKGRGESVWLGWFLLDTLRRFAPVCETRGDLATAQLLTERAATLAQALRDHAWDGGWYRRAYHDDGSALGTADAEACEIDAIAQSWAVLSGGDGSGREHEAMAAVGERLMRAEDGLVLLFEPPFKAGAKDVGYIGAYPPGVRENGGQYTHAAAWTGLAFARLGNAERTAEVLRILNPINHALTAEAVRHYRVEPYVLAADVYGYPPHVGRGGWTWYTGSAAWYYRFILEGVLGITRRGDTLMIKPCLPPHWPGATVTWRHRGSVYHIQLVRTASAPPNTLSAPCTLPMLDDGAEHRVAVYIV